MAIRSFQNMNYFYDLDIYNGVSVFLFFVGFLRGVIFNTSPKITSRKKFFQNKTIQKILQNKIFRAIFNYETISYLMMIVGILMATDHFIATQTTW